MVTGELERHGHEVVALAGGTASGATALVELLVRQDVHGLVLGVPAGGPLPLLRLLGDPALAAWREAQAVPLVIVLTDEPDGTGDLALLEAGATHVWHVRSTGGAAGAMLMDVALQYAAAALAGEGLEREVSLLRRMLDTARAAFCISDPGLPDDPVVYVNGEFERLTGYRREEVLGRNCRFLQGPGTDRAVVRALGEALREGQPVEVEVLNYRADGRPFWNHLAIDPVHGSDGRVSRFVGVQTDVTQRLAELSTAEAAALEDELTRLPNRRALLEELRQAEARALRHEEPVAVLFIDLDGFKEVNDSHGHAAGDEVLRDVALRLRSSVRSGEFLARVGGDEFVVVLDRADDDAAVAAGRRLLDALEAGGPAGAHPDAAAPRASIGAASGAPPRVTLPELVARADAALYRAKAAGGGVATALPGA
ncbi:PAS domain S-box-containing protein/diguanylate cyclase (GGDEF)-like protein [Motilibacter rhizosphaerae]|uniref:PAS domain S-box-containing protein/diguanylate cyclase (GGDEF)-like protein n=1 Tax=Motilibacter rhizosphaerae TaxID=598652 RepID=A0A4Q7NWS4_9ACTN|nr:PAS domain S-box-containing protein/diguanylate cyclase (GGDEF)-like protein [Motilibacter rhizosphaerae]